MRGATRFLAAAIPLFVVASCSSNDGLVTAGTTALTQPDTSNVSTAAQSEPDGSEPDESAPDESAPVESTDSTVTDSSAPSDSASTPSVTSGSTIVVSDPGVEPRRELRYSLTAGSRSVVTNVIEQQLEMSISGEAQNTDSTLTTETEVTAQDDDTVAIRYVSMDAGGGVPSSMTDSIEKLVMTASIDPRGAVTAFESNALDLDLPGTMAGLIDSLLTAVQQLAVQFPEEAVGVGAEWTTTVNTSIGGLPMQVITTSTVTALDRSTVTLATSGTLGLSGDEINIPGVPAGSEVDAVMDGKVTGTQIVDFSKPFAIAGTSTTISDAEIGISGRTMVQHLEQKVTSTVR